MPDGGDLRFTVSREVKVAVDRPPGLKVTPRDLICVTVADTGTGMTEEVQSHLFEPFFTTKEVGKGTGLGLAQVYGIVRQHKGTIDVETAPGEGTAFHICLPHAKTQEEGEEGPGEVTGTAKEPQPRIAMGHGETILVVEDAVQMRAAVRDGLDALNYRVLTAKNGREALEAVTLSDVDLVLTDIVMPTMGGRTLLHSLRSQAPRLDVVAMTGYILEEETDELRAVGFSDVIAKPFTVEELAVVVRNALDRSSDPS
jgi:CheY-like chemotaxis protein